MTESRVASEKPTVPCPDCDGWGQTEESSRMDDCPNCEGEGVVCAECKRNDCLAETGFVGRCIGKMLEEDDELAALEEAFQAEARRWRSLKALSELYRSGMERGRAEADKLSLRIKRLEADLEEETEQVEFRVRQIEQAAGELGIGHLEWSNWVDIGEEVVEAAAAVTQRARKAKAEGRAEADKLRGRARGAEMALERVSRERDVARLRARRAGQILIEAIGAPGPESVVETAKRAVAKLDRIRAVVDAAQVLCDKSFGWGVHTVTETSTVVVSFDFDADGDANPAELLEAFTDALDALKEGDDDV